MDRAAVTFDFHNTIAQCDEWFDIEVRGLISSFLQWQSDVRGVPVDPQTLWSADEAYRQLRLAVQEHGNELTAEVCVATVLDELNLPFEDSEIRRGVEELMRPIVEFAHPLPGALKTIRDLAAADVPLGIVSSAVHHPFVVWALDQFGVGQAFEVVTTSASSGYYKSRPEIYLTAISSLGAAPEKSVHVGDNLHFDVGGAQQAGMRTILVADSRWDDEKTPQPDVTLPNLIGSAPHILDLLNREVSDGNAYPFGVER